MRKLSGFTLIELIIVIVILGILAVSASAKFLDLSRDAKISVLTSIAGEIRETNKLVQTKARVKGLRATSTNPGGIQTGYVVDFGFGSAEVDFRNLCPEAQAEAGDKLTFFDFVEIDGDDLTTRTTNQYAAVGYDVPTGNLPQQSGCYVYYDSFDLACAVVVVDQDC